MERDGYGSLFGVYRHHQKTGHAILHDKEVEELMPGIAKLVNQIVEEMKEVKAFGAQGLKSTEKDEQAHYNITGSLYHYADPRQKKEGIKYLFNIKEIERIKHLNT